MIKDPDRSNELFFWRGNPDNNEEFGLSELLYDISVCQTETTRSMESKPRCLKFVSKASWVVESEFSENTRHILFDMSKLVIGTASNTLFVVSYRSDKNDELLDRLKPVARQIDGNLFLAFVPHPRDWFKVDQEGSVLYRWKSDEGDFVKRRDGKAAL